MNQEVCSPLNSYWHHGKHQKLRIKGCLKAFYKLKRSADYIFLPIMKKEMKHVQYVLKCSQSRIKHGLIITDWWYWCLWSHFRLKHLALKIYCKKQCRNKIISRSTLQIHVTVNKSQCQMWSSNFCCLIVVIPFFQKLLQFNLIMKNYVKTTLFNKCDFSLQNPPAHSLTDAQWKKSINSKDIKWHTVLKSYWPTCVKVCLLLRHCTPIC